VKISYICCFYLSNQSVLVLSEVVDHSGNGTQFFDKTCVY